MKPGDLVRLMPTKKYGIVIKDLGDEMLSVLWANGRIVAYPKNYITKA